MSLPMCPACHGTTAKAFQVSFPAVHLARFPCKSVPGVFPCRPPATESLQNRVRCPFLPSTWHGFPAKAFQVSFPAIHLPRNPCESVPGVLSCRPPATESLRKCSRCLSLPSTCHGFPAKVFQVSHPAFHLPRNSRKSVSGVPSRLPPATEIPQKRVRCPIPPSTWHGNPAKACQVAPLASHLARKSRESVPGVTFCLPPATVSPQKCVRCHLLPSTWHGIPAKAFQVSFSASHLPRNPRKSVPCSTSCLPPAAAVPLIMGCRDFSAGQISSFQQEASNHRHT